LKLHQTHQKPAETNQREIANAKPPTTGSAFSGMDVKKLASSTMEAF
jgi:hypothetical protein